MSFIFQTDSEYGRDSSNLKKYETEVENITKQLQNMNYEDGSFEEKEENHNVRLPKIMSKHLFNFYDLGGTH